MIKFAIGFFLGVVVSLLCMDYYYDYRATHESLFSSEMMESFKDGCAESKERVKETCEHSKQSIKNWISPTEDA